VLLSHQPNSKLFKPKKFPEDESGYLKRYLRRRDCTPGGFNRRAELLPEAIFEETEAGSEFEEPVEHPRSILTLPAWLLANQADSEPAATAEAESSIETEPIDLGEKEPEFSDLVAGEEAASVPLVVRR
jgi:hypothetical protein